MAALLAVVLGRPAAGTHPAPTFLQILANQVKEKREAMEQANTELAKTAAEPPLANQLDQIDSEIVDTQAAIAQLPFEMESEKQRTLQSYIQSAQPGITGEANYQAQLGALNERIQQLTAIVRDERNQIDQLEALNANVDSLNELVPRCQADSTVLSRLQGQYAALKIEAERAADLAQKRNDWQFQSDQDRVRQNADRSEQTLQERLQQLQKQYAAIQKKDAERRSRLSQLEETYQRLRGDFEELNAIYLAAKKGQASG